MLSLDAFGLRPCSPLALTPVLNYPAFKTWSSFDEPLTNHKLQVGMKVHCAQLNKRPQYRCFCLVSLVSVAFSVTWATWSAWKLDFSQWHRQMEPFRSTLEVHYCELWSLSILYCTTNALFGQHSVGNGRAGSTFTYMSGPIITRHLTSDMFHQCMVCGRKWLERFAYVCNKFVCYKVNVLVSAYQSNGKLFDTVCTSLSYQGLFIADFRQCILELHKWLHNTPCW